MSRWPAAALCVALLASPTAAWADEADEAADTDAASTDTAATDGADGKLIGGIAAVVLGAGALGMSIYATVRVGELNDDVGFQVYRSEVPISADACDMARDGVEVTAPEGAATASATTSLCDEGDALTIMQAVGYPVAAIATGLGMYLLATSPTVTEGRRVQVLPRVGFEGGGVDVVVRF